MLYIYKALYVIVICVGKKDPFYYFQFHPEKNIYEWDRDVLVDHSPKSVEYKSGHTTMIHSSLFMFFFTGKKYPFFYFQFHPEKNFYKWDQDTLLNIIHI